SADDGDACRDCFQAARRAEARRYTFTFHPNAIADLDVVDRLRKQRRRANRLARAQIETGVMPRAVNRVADDEPLAERTAIVRARCADGENISPSTHQ